MTLQDHLPTISIGAICNLRFADDIDLMGGSNGELQVSRQRWCIWYGNKFRKVEDHGQQHERHRRKHHSHDIEKNVIVLVARSQYLRFISEFNSRNDATQNVCFKITLQLTMKVKTCSNASMVTIIYLRYT